MSTDGDNSPIQTIVQFSNDEDYKRKKEELKSLANQPVIGINGLPWYPNIKLDYNKCYED